MPRIVKSIEIDAPSERVFDFVANAEKQSEWVTPIRAIEVTSGDGKSRGTVDRCLVKIGPFKGPLDAEWTEYRPGEAYGKRILSGSAEPLGRRHLLSGLRMQGRMAFTPLNEGTRVQWSIEYKPPMGLMGAVADVLFMNRLFQNEIEESLEKLKAALEG